MPTPGAPLDTLLRVETPEGIFLTLRPAGVVPRGLAYGVDWLLRMLLLMVLALTLQNAGGYGMGLLLLGYFALEWGWPVLFECLPGSATPGKRLMGLRVVMASGLPVTPSASMLRNVLRAADFLPGAYLLGLGCMLVRPDFRRLGDVVADTLVIHTRQPGWQRPWPDGPAAPPPRPLSLAQQAAVLGLAERAARLTPERLDELALLADEVLPEPDRHAPPEQARPGERLLALARWLAGQREAGPA